MPASGQAFLKVLQMIITIDTGTTNTRVSLFQQGIRIDMIKSDVGVRNTSIDGNNRRLVETIASAISQLKEQHQLQDQDIEAILAAGMITSNLGLYEVPHLIAPVALQDFTANVCTVVLEEISPLPIHFIPGVKNIDTSNLSSIEGLDIMRGEEVEALAIAALLNVDHDAIIALPGSHSKFVAMDAKQTILGCCTTLAGELNAIITNHTILTNSLQGRYAETLCHDSLLDGYQAAEKYGMGHALFSIRLNEQFGGKSHEQLASFLVGVILHSDIKALSSTPQMHFSESTSIYVGGNGLLCDATAILLSHYFPENQVIQCSEIKDLSAKGSIYVAKQAGIIQ